MALTPDSYTVSNSLTTGSFPSIYEVIAEDNLSKSLRSGIKYLSSVLASNHPNYFRLLHQYFDEIYLVYELIVQGLHLSSYNASFSEYFYSLRRLKLDSSCAKEFLSTRDVITSLLVMVSFPYIKAKLDKIHDELSRIHSDGLITQESDKFAYHFVNNYPYIKTLWEVSSLVYQIKYAVGKSSTHSPVLHLLGQRLIRGNPKDLVTSSKPFTSSLASLAFRLTKGVGLILTSSALIIQFLDYWYSRENSRSALSTITIPPPPPRRDTVNFPPNICPICSKPRINEVLLKSSGFLFCQECLVDWVDKHGKCPVTGYPTSQSQIVSIYLPDSY